jgi:hypothetical protein
LVQLGEIALQEENYSRPTCEYGNNKSTHLREQVPTISLFNNKIFVIDPLNFDNIQNWHKTLC